MGERMKERKRWSKVEEKALGWLNIMAEVSLHLTLFLLEGDYDDFSRAKELLEQLAREVTEKR